ncbi:hypothetical protein BDV06DRAFT_220087 [Aspergillus oleicola]
MVEGLQTEQPRLVRSRIHQAPASNTRAPLPMQVRPQSAVADAQKGYGQAQAQAGAYGPGKVPPIVITSIPEEPELAHTVRKDRKDRT